MGPAQLCMCWISIKQLKVNNWSLKRLSKFAKLLFIVKLRLILPPILVRRISKFIIFP